MKITAQKIKNFIKASKLFGFCWLFFGYILITILKVFVKPNEKQILFMSYSGRQYSDTPLEAYHLLREDPDFADYELVWAFNRPQDFQQSAIRRKVSSNNISYFYHLLKSKYWISNTSIDRLVPFKHPNNIYIQFWHGIPMKALGHAENGLAPLVQYWYDHVQIDDLFTYGPYDTEKLTNLFPQTQNVLEVGQLRKNINLRYDRLYRAKRIKKQLNIKNNKPVLLYVPTYRSGSDLHSGILSDQALQQLTTKYNVIYRGHYFTEDEKPDNLIVASKFSLYKLFIVADVLVTDYSSVFFDFAVYQRPIYLIQTDIDSYRQERGFSFEPSETGLPIFYKEQVFVQQLLETKPYPVEKLVQLNQKFNSHAATETVQSLKQIIKEN
ncbi:CDP-glycerol glycerophosphotransferase family protein [Weissella kandleri]|nr:CDP-glycerol glycerophosphotransferase family protein [Weissella kandleri]